MTSLTRIPDSFWRSIGMQLVGVNDRGQLFPNIWVFHSINISPPTMISSSSQHLFVQFCVGGIAHGLVFVYAATTSVARRPLWSAIEQINTSFSGPLLLVGDFNAILGAHEKTGGRLPTRVSCDDFQTMVDVCHLTHIDIKGSPFTWTNGQGVGSHIEMLLDRKLKLLKPILKEWNVNVFGNVHTAVDSARTALEQIQLAISLDGFTEAPHVEELLAQDALSNALLVQEKFWAEKARRMEILMIQVWLKISFLPWFRIQKIALPSAEDVKNVVFSMNVDSAPGPDGYTGHFFQACWDVVGLDVVRAVRSFFQSGYILPNLNSSFVALIPKVQEANVITQFRPIAMANFSFKIITRILADRLAPIASRIILPNQFAFLKGRQISDCIFLASECVNLLDNKCCGGNVAIKFDVAKAFDTLNWDFLRRVLNAFGFHATFVDWISSILASARLSILFNGSPVGFFGCSRGVRQGDPLSPLLFCHAEEVLSRGLLCLVDMGHVQAISSPRPVKVPSHVLFADDIMVFCKGDKRSLLNLMAFFEEYGLNSGQLVNKTKSHVYLGKSAVHRRTLIYSWLGVPVGKLPFMYLGVPIFVGRPKQIYFQVLADRIRNVMSQWRGHSLSMAGRVTLVNSVVVSMLSHSFTIYAWPRTVLQQVRNWMRNFIWTGNVSSRAYHPVSWKKCCAPLKEGGLGVRNIMALNNAFLLKKFWDFLTKSTPAAAFFSARFLQHSGQPCPYYKKSSIWPGMRPLFMDIFYSSKWLVGNGRSIDFWHGNWLNGSIVDKLGIDHQLGKLLCAKVSDFIKDGSWYCSTNLYVDLATLWSEISAIRLPYSDMEDRLVWLDSSDGNLSLSIAYELKRSKQAIAPWDRWHGFGTQLQLLWWGMMGAGFYSLWNARNSIRFDERCLTVDYLIHSIKLQIREVDSWGFGIMRNSVDELCIFSALGISGRASRTHQIHEVNWLAPCAFQLKVNTDGAARGTPGLAGYGGIFRDHLGNFMGCFASSMGIATALEAELQAIIHAVTIASRKGWNSLWIECDSALPLFTICKVYRISVFANFVVLDRLHEKVGLGYGDFCCMVADEL
ncbi:uncharacterized protein LOC133716631 [Rosa rugosa]|uniref:uncharacterized protein LOC133716631 n=1 Tax=Rosa rugosa TaxID=74645 RepID=UPI002B417E49|nr:uncharacterized protein LOC133716631 [Rosa rugosa]